MRLGLVGRGPQAQRYLMPKNGGEHIVKQLRGRPEPAEYQEWFDDLDGVIIATHPSNHRWLCLDAIYAKKAVLCEKPLALNLEDCEEILDAAEKTGVAFDVAHVHVWATHFRRGKDPGVAHAAYHTHDRDYSAWLDWGPHVLSLMAYCYPSADSDALRERVIVAQVPEDQPRRVHAGGYDWDYDSRTESAKTPMSLMVNSFARGLTHNIHFNRRVYRALFAKEDHATR